MISKKERNALLDLVKTRGTVSHRKVVQIISDKPSDFLIAAVDLFDDPVADTPAYLCGILRIVFLLRAVDDGDHLMQSLGRYATHESELVRSYVGRLAGVLLRQHSSEFNADRRNALQELVNHVRSLGIDQSTDEFLSDDNMMM